MILSKRKETVNQSLRSAGVAPAQCDLWGMKSVKRILIVIVGTDFFRNGARGK